MIRQMLNWNTDVVLAYNDLICERFFEFEHLLTEADKQRLPLHFQNLKK